MPAAYDPNTSYVLDPEYAAGRKPFDEVQQYLAENPGATINSSADYWAAFGRDREHPTLGMTPDELYANQYPEAAKYIDRTGDSRYYQPGEAEFRMPDYDWVKTQTPEQLMAGGYSVSPSQWGNHAELSPIQQVEYLQTLQGTDGFDPRYPGQFVPIGSEANRKHPPPHWLVQLGKAALQSAVISGFTGVGLDLLGGVGAPVPDISGVPNIPGLGGTGGLESGLFPSTTIPPTGLESGLFPYTTPGAGLGTVPAWGVGGSTIPGLGGSNLGSNLGSSLLPNVNDAYSLYKKGKTGLGIVNQLTGGSLLGGGNQNTGGNLGGGTQKQQSSQPDWAKLFSAAAFATPLPKQEFITDEVSTVKAPEQVSEMWQGLTPEQTNIIGMKAGGSVKMVPGPENRDYARHAKRGFHVKGIGTGQSDEIPTMLAKDEYVIDSDTVSALGDGSSEAGAAVLDKMREEIRKHKRSAPIDKIPPQAKSPLEYMRRKA
jgi:hypothetical protein